VRLVALVPLVAACGSQLCMKPEYARTARVTSEYQLVTISNGARNEERGFGPEALTMHLYDPFECTPGSLKDSKHFYVELAPECRLMATPASHLRDTGRNASGKFIRAEAPLVEGRRCALSLDGGRRIEGKVKSAVMIIRPVTVSVDLVLDVSGGTFHMTQTGTWL
jgi:hypothetical protein